MTDKSLRKLLMESSTAKEQIASLAELMNVPKEILEEFIYYDKEDVEEELVQFVMTHPSMSISTHIRFALLVGNIEGFEEALRLIQEPRVTLSGRRKIRPRDSQGL